MGMFDKIRCKYPLPVEGSNALTFQTKDTPDQFLSLYEIRKDGSLWFQNCKIVDRSNPKAKGFARFCGIFTRTKPRWVPVKNLTGEIRFYEALGEYSTGWIEFSAYFVKGKIKHLELIKHRKPNKQKERQRAKDMEKLAKTLRAADSPSKKQRENVQRPNK